MSRTTHVKLPSAMMGMTRHSVLLLLKTSLLLSDVTRAQQNGYGEGDDVATVPMYIPTEPDQLQGGEKGPGGWTTGAKVGVAVVAAFVALMVSCLLCVWCRRRRRRRRRRMDERKSAPGATTPRQTVHPESIVLENRAPLTQPERAATRHVSSHTRAGNGTVPPPVNRSMDPPPPYSSR